MFQIIIGQSIVVVYKGLYFSGFELSVHLSFMHYLFDYALKGQGRIKSIFYCDS
jgi:hypothetical protein